jgi:hypothetical protein
VFLDQGDHVAARTSLKESLIIRQELGNRRDMAASLVGLAGVAAAQGQLELSARLLAATSALLETIGGRLDAADHTVSERTTATVRANLREDQFAAAWSEGRALSLEQAIVIAERDHDCGTSGPQKELSGVVRPRSTTPESNIADGP